MPRAKSDGAKSSGELNAEIQELQKTLAAKQKLKKAAERREKAEADQVREYEEANFNREFTQKAKEIHVSDFASDGRTVYEIIKAIIRPPVSPEPEQEEGKTERVAGPLMGPYLEQMEMPNT